MGNRSEMLLRVIGVVFLALSISACDAIGAVFKAGVWAGVILVVLVVLLVVFVVSKLRRRV